MMQLKMEVNAIEFDSEAYTQRLAENIYEQMVLAAQAFARAALKRIPTFHPPSGGIPSERSTGFTAGAFKNIRLLRQIGKKNRDNFADDFPELDDAQGQVVKRILREGIAALNAGRGAKTISKKVKGRTFKIRQEYYQGVVKTPETGRQFATPPSQIIVRRGLSFMFNFGVNITYFSIQDVRRGKSKHSPWGAIQAGIEAFQARMLSSTTKKAIFPKIQEFFIKKTYKVDYKGNVFVSTSSSKFHNL